MASAAVTSVRGVTPKPGMPRPTASIPQANVNLSHPRGRTPVGIGTPQSVPTPGAAAIPTPTSNSAAFSSPPPPLASASLPAAQPKRGIKREREPTVDGPQATGYQNGAANGNGNGAASAKPAVVVSAKAGNAGVRPRPLKKQRMVCSYLSLVVCPHAHCPDCPPCRTRRAQRGPSPCNSRRRVHNPRRVETSYQPSPISDGTPVLASCLSALPRLCHVDLVLTACHLRAMPSLAAAPTY